MTSRPVDWTIKTWDRSLGRGSLTSPQLGDLPFDAAIALVDDFHVGEPVHVELQRVEGALVVAKLWPDDPRFVSLAATAAAAPSLSLPKETRLRDRLAQMSIELEYRVAAWHDALVIQGDDDLFAYGHSQEVRFTGACYAELPSRWSGKSFRLGGAAERDHVATRTEVCAETAVVRIVDEERRIFLVACDDVEISGHVVPRR